MFYYPSPRLLEQLYSLIEAGVLDYRTCGHMTCGHTTHSRVQVVAGGHAVHECERRETEGLFFVFSSLALMGINFHCGGMMCRVLELYKHRLPYARGL